MKELLSRPISLMIMSVILWMLYPPLINQTINSSNMFSVAVFIHVVAALSNLFLVLFFIKDKKKLKKSLLDGGLKLLIAPALISGVLICANHLLLYAALQSSERLDVLTILVFETWPLLFFFLDTFFRRNSRELLLSDSILSGIAFFGFVLLSTSKVAMSDWSSSGEDIVLTLSLALAGGIAMAATCFYRMKCVDRWKIISEKENLGLSGLQMSLYTEVIVRIVAAPMFVISMFAFSEPGFDFGLSQSMYLVFVGVGILSVGSLIYDLSIYKSESASIGAIWYFMPVGAVIVLAVMKQEWLSGHELIAVGIIFVANLFIGLRLDILNMRNYLSSIFKEF